MIGRQWHETLHTTTSDGSRSGDCGGGYCKQPNKQPSDCSDETSEIELVVHGGGQEEKACNMRRRGGCFEARKLPMQKNTKKKNKLPILPGTINRTIVVVK